MAVEYDQVYNDPDNSMEEQVNGNCLNGESETDNILPFHLPDLTPALIEEARLSLNETEETRQKALEEFRKLIKDEKNLVTRTDELFLLSFLRARKFEVKKAFKLFQKFWKFKTDYRHIYEKMDPTILQNIFSKDFIGFLFYRDRNGCVVFILKMGLWNPDEYTYEDLVRAVSGMLLHANEIAATQIAGYRAIIDLRQLSWIQIKQCTPDNALFFIRSVLFNFPGRYKGVHVLVDNSIIVATWRIIQPLIPSKLAKRIFFYNDDLNGLLDYIHPSVLPQEFGGQAEVFENSKWAEVIKKYCTTMQEWLSYGYRY